MNDKDLKKIAYDIHHGQIFVSVMIPPEDRENLMGMVFMAFLMSSQTDREEMVARDIAVIYEYLNKSAPRSINGFPIFMSHRELTGEQWDKIRNFLDKIEEIEKQVMAATMAPAKSDDGHLRGVEGINP